MEDHNFEVSLCYIARFCLKGLKLKEKVALACGLHPLTTELFMGFPLSASFYAKLVTDSI